MSNSQDNFESILAEIEAEEKGGKTEKSTKTVEQSEVEEVKEEKKPTYTFAHEEIIEEEGINKKDLPDKIQKMISTFERKKRMAIKQGENESTMLKIQNLSTLIADQIITWMESDGGDMKETAIKEDGGSVDDFMTGEDIVSEDSGGAEEIDIIDDGETGNVEDDIDIDYEEGGNTVDEPLKTNLFSGVLGGIFNWND